ncbi:MULTISPECIES: hypothetical protein [unclassified Streptomyces]|uniref:hypothetical protein n=1 Tax=unclassified Streptomyces TaxID=2593676 RepID=UPI0018F87804|nr:MULTISPECIES: hypothetical protein [unclassified Streptomyces]
MSAIQTYEVDDAAPEVRPLPAKANRSGHGALRGQIHTPDDFDELPDDIAEAFGMQ